MRYTRLWRDWLLFIAAIGLLLSACTGTGSTGILATPPGEQPAEPIAERSPQPVTIRFAVRDFQRDAYKDLAAVFMEANPDVHIQFVSADELRPPIEPVFHWDEWGIRLSAAADVFPVGEDFYFLAPKGRLRDLASFIEADGDFQREDFYPGVLEHFQWHGGTWAVPVGLDVQLIAYHKPTFDAVGIPYPQPGWTWEDLTTKAQALTERGDRVTRWGLGLCFPYGDLNFIESWAGSLIDYTSDPPVPRFDRPEFIKTVQRYTALCAESVITRNLSVDGRLLYNGKVAAMWTETFSGWSFTSPRTGVGLAPFPVDAHNPQSTLLLPQGLAMSAGTRHPEAAWRWIEFLSRQNISSLFFPHLPARRSVAEATGFWESLDAETAAVLDYALQHGYTAWSLEAGRGALGSAVEAILAGEKSVEDALTEAKAQAIKRMREEQERLARITPLPPFTVGEEEYIPKSALVITFIAATDASNRQRYLDLAACFHEAHPDIAVEIATLDSLADPLDLSTLATRADCFLASPDLRRPQDREAVLSLRPLLDADPSYPADDFYPAALPPFTWQGDLRGLPAELVPYVVEFNRDLFDAARVAYPRPNWTYDEFVARAVALTKGEGERIQYGFAPEPFADYALPLILERWGADLLDERQSPPAPTLDSPATVAALRRYTNLALVHRVQPAFALDLAQPSGEALAEWESLIRNGRAAMWMVSSSRSAYLRQRRGGNIGVAPLPAGGGSNGYVQAKGYFISAQSRAPQACWEWLKFLSAQPEAVEGLPARRSVAESPAYRQRVGDERAEAYLAAVRDVNPHSFTLTAAQHPWLRGVEFWLFRAYTQAVNGETSVEAALDEAQGLANAYRACVVAREAFFDQGEWEACLEEVDPALPNFLFGPGGEGGE